MSIIDLIIIVIIFFAFLMFGVIIQEELKISSRFNKAILICSAVLAAGTYYTILILFV